MLINTQAFAAPAQYCGLLGVWSNVATLHVPVLRRYLQVIWTFSITYLLLFISINIVVVVHRIC
jgi:hypothetical protein